MTIEDMVEQLRMHGAVISCSSLTQRNELINKLSEYIPLGFEPMCYRNHLYLFCWHGHIHCAVDIGDVPGTGHYVIDTSIFTEQPKFEPANIAELYDALMA